MNMQNFAQIVLDQFKFLISDYGFKRSKKRKHPWGYEFIFVNNTTGIRITYEYRETFLFIRLYKLVNGELIENSYPIKNNTVLHSFYLDDIVSIRNPKAAMYPLSGYSDDSEFHNKEHGLSLYVSRFAENLKTYAEDVLTGNFELFTELDQIVKKRAKQAR
ncbi:hypothetical protein U27_05202 [Candidatus Vecturithrix granuli]|uniref:DUF4304 domain-containing protein n=1 Tax=Vecturithrix granuli TaxID=1499967 RepID=A0A081C0X4_VECG1|nr:hypothetical protein U27_05202 [Candidatus Vecturithrix granuli]